MKGTEVSGYRTKSKEELLKAIDECLSLSQLFALIQLEGISMQMHSQSSASNITPRVLSPQEIIAENDSPLDRLKLEIRKAVEESRRDSKSLAHKKPDSRLLSAIDECDTLMKLFELIQHEGISIRMHAQTGASNVTQKVLPTNKKVEKKDTPLDRLKQQVKKAVQDYDN